MPRMPISQSDLDKRLAAAVQRVIDLAGGQTALAATLTALTGKRVRQSKISMWLHRGRVPAEWVILCETAIKREMERFDIRPDIYPRERVVNHRQRVARC